jgi:tetratricopeptide (TPR) repeat protein
MARMGRNLCEVANSVLAQEASLTGSGASVIPFAVAKSIEQELKQPDEFVSFWTHVGNFLSKNLKAVLIGTVALVVVIAGSLIFSHLRDRGAEKTTAAFAQIGQIASAEVIPEKTDKTEKNEPSPARSEGLRFKTESERLEATVKEADRFVAAHSGGNLARYALFTKAGRLVVLGKASEAVPIYQQLIASETMPDMKMIQQDALATATEAAGNLDEALRLYSALAEESARAGNFLLDQVLYSKARILEKQGKGKDAEKVLREILEKTPKTTLRREIDDRLAVLGEK